MLRRKSEYLFSLRSPVVGLNKDLKTAIIYTFKQLKVTFKELKNTMITMINQIETLNKV